MKMATKVDLHFFTEGFLLSGDYGFPIKAVITISMPLNFIYDFAGLLWLIINNKHQSRPFLHIETALKSSNGFYMLIVFSIM